MSRVAVTNITYPALVHNSVTASGMPLVKRMRNLSLLSAKQDSQDTIVEESSAFLFVNLLFEPSTRESLL